ncbi:MAG: adenosine deaminase [Thermoanaerobaculia bacterium]
MTSDARLERFVERMPKVELHVHLEGTIQPATLLKLAERRRVHLPADDVEGLRQWFRFRDSEHFVHIFLTCSKCLRDPEDFQLVAREFLAEQSRQNVLYSEVHFTIGSHLANGVDGDEVADALDEVRREGERAGGVRMRWIPDIVRNVGPARADRTLEWALDGRRKGVVALGLSGFESEPNEPFREHFQVAAAEGLHRVAHAGEHGGPDSIRSVLEIFDAERIGHGIRAADDPALVEELAGRGIPLEVCPSSNVRLGVVAELARHPFDRLWRSGVAVTVNSDDPTFFDTTLTQEYLALSRAFGYGAPQLATLSLTALEHAFLDRPERSAFEEEFRRQFADLGAELLGDPVTPAGV